MNNNTPSEKTHTKDQIALYIDWVISLQESIVKSGGCPHWNSIKRMSLEVVCWFLSPTGIRFTHNPNASLK